MNTYTLPVPEARLPKTFIKIKERTFQIRYLSSLNLVTIRGWSITKDLHQKYAELLMNIENHLAQKDCLNIYCHFELFNTSSVKYIFTMIKMLNKAYSNGKKVKVFWSCNCENESEMIDMGLDFAGLSDFKFSISYL